eukprot:SAG11_NODE_5049_length_1679_cov_5.387975_1_plen_177_part_00
MEGQLDGKRQREKTARAVKATQRLKQRQSADLAQLDAALAADIVVEVKERRRRQKQQQQAAGDAEDSQELSRARGAIGTGEDSDDSADKGWRKAEGSAGRVREPRSSAAVIEESTRNTSGRRVLASTGLYDYVLLELLPVPVPATTSTRTCFWILDLRTKFSTAVDPDRMIGAGPT